MASDCPDLTALLGSRICHDLISPLGAIGNGVELLMMSGTAPGPEMALISESVSNANARIRFFRVAFGAAGADQRLGRPEIVSILSDLTRGSRLQIDWLAEGDPPRAEAKLVFLALQCLESALPWGGRITVDKAGRNWRLAAEAQKLRAEPELWQGLSGAALPPGLAAAQVHFALLPQEAARQNRRIEAEIAETGIEMRL